MNTSIGNIASNKSGVDVGFIFPRWPAPANVRAVVTTRRAPGVSLSPFDRCNLGDHVGDDPFKVTANRVILREYLLLPEEPRWLRQVHGVDVFEADKKNPGDNATIVADASITHTPEKVLAVLTADCLPIFLCAIDGSEIAAIHAGWRGLAAGVIEETCAHMRTPCSRLLAWLGPAIGPKAFTVGEDVRRAFLDIDSNAETTFHALSTESKWRCDLYQLARQRLLAQGVKQIFGGDDCTYSDSVRFYSYRRDGITGRMASLIWITSSAFANPK